MTIRLATFNMENLFSRPRAMNGATWTTGKPVLDEIAKLTGILEKDAYSSSDKVFIVKTLNDYGPGAAVADRFFEVNQTRPQLYKKPQGGGFELVADGRGGWRGWVELIRDDIRWDATENTGRVVEAVKPDVLLTVEVEDRLTLQRFNDQVLKGFGVEFPYNALIDGNDPRGIDVGVYSKYPVRAIRSHIFDEDAAGVIFSRDCPEFEIELPSGEPLRLLGNHWKSKGNGTLAQTTAKRLRQAKRVVEIYNAARQETSRVVVAGDLNDTYDSDPVKWLRTHTNLEDVMKLPVYQGKPGTYASGNTPNQKLDYIFLPPELQAVVQAVDVERGGVYAPRAGNPLPTVTSGVNQASDHGSVWVDLNV